MVRINLVDIDRSDDEDVRDLYRFMEETGRNYNSDHWRLEANFPEVMEHILRARIALWEEGGLSREILEKIAVAVSVANGCEYCTGAFCTHLLDMGIGSDAVADFVRQASDGEFTDRDDAVLEFAIQSLEDPDGVTDGQVETLRDEHGLTDRDLIQIVYVVNLISGFNRIVDTFDAEYDSDFPASVVTEAMS